MVRFPTQDCKPVVRSLINLQEMIVSRYFSEEGKYVIERLSNSFPTWTSQQQLSRGPCPIMEISPRSCMNTSNTKTLIIIYMSIPWRSCSHLELVNRAWLMSSPRATLLSLSIYVTVNQVDSPFALYIKPGNWSWPDRFPRTWFSGSRMVWKTRSYPWEEQHSIWRIYHRLIREGVGNY